MKSISVALQAHFGLATTTLAVLWKVTRRDGTILGFTTHDADIFYNAVTYLASSGFLPSANDYKSDFSVDSSEIDGFLDNVVIKESDIRNRLYDFAVVEQRVVNWANLSQGDVILRKGIIGNIKMVAGILTAEIRGLTQYFSTQVGSLFGPLCRAELFSSGGNNVDPGSKWLCHVKEADYTQTGTVSSTVGDARTIIPNSGLLQIGSTTPSAPAPAGWFNDGELTFTTGPNSGYSFEIKTWDGTTLSLLLPMPFPPHASDSFTIIPGCDKTASATGCLKFKGYDKNQNIVAITNIANFRGENTIPGMDQILNVPDATPPPSK